MYIFLFLTALVSLYLLKLVFYRTSADCPLPPGPKPLPIVGNVRDMPAPGSAEWLHWLKHKELYGTCTPLPESVVLSGNRTYKYGVCSGPTPDHP
jgi:hypothetical protein